ncbi:MAG: helix-turn-helix domain-containing protein [Bacteroidota bacterium]
MQIGHTVSLIDFVAIVGTFEGLLISIFLLLKESVKSEANRWLGLLVVSITSVLLPGAIQQLGLRSVLPHVVHLQMVTLLLNGPATYFYVRSCTQKDFKTTTLAWLHFLPALLALCYHLPFYLSPNEDKIAAFIQFAQQGRINYPLWVPLSKIVHSTIYFVISFQLVIKYRKHLTNTTSYIDNAFQRWLLVFCFVLLIPLISVVVFTISSYQLFSSTTFYSAFFLFILFIHFGAILKPSLFHLFPHQMQLPTVEKAKKQKYERSALQATQKEIYIEQLQTYMQTHKPYLNPELTMPQLSEAVNISTHSLSQIINEKLDCSFLEFINQYRVAEAKVKLEDAAFDNYTISAIASDAGFKARSTFYTAFKKHAGITPNEYRKQQKEKRT